MTRALASALLAACVAFGSVASAAEADDAGQPSAALVFRWEKLPGAVSYVIEISEDKAFDRVVVKQSVPENGFRWETPGQQAYFWRVRGVDADGREGRNSEIRFVGKIVTPPRLIAPGPGEAIAVHPGPVLLRWQRSEFLRTYLVETAPDPAFAGAATHEVSRTQYAFAPPQPGLWYWRVGGVDLNGDRVSPGESRSFDLERQAAGGSGLSVGLALGAFQDFHGQTAGGGRLDLAWGLRDDLAVVLEPGLYRGFQDRGPSGTLTTVPVDLLARWRRPIGAGGIELAAGPALAARIDPQGEEAIGAGARIEAGWVRPVGVGEIFVDAGARWVAQDRVLPGSGVTASVGWRIEVW